MILAATVVTTASATLGLVKLGLVPRVMYLPPKLTDQLAGTTGTTSTSTGAPFEDEDFTIRRPTPAARKTPDNAAIAKISKKGMAAVEFMLSFQSVRSLSDADKKRFAEENEGKMVDWELVVALEGRIESGGRPYILCEPLHFERWSDSSGLIGVHGDQKSTGVVLSVAQDDRIYVRGQLDLRGAEVDTIEVQDAKIEPVKPSQ